MEKIGFTFYFVLCSVIAFSQWTQEPSGTAYPLNCVCFADSNTGYVGSYGGLVLKTNDAGATWISLNVNRQCYVNSVYFTDVNTGFAAGYDYYYSYLGVILKTTDGGITWTTEWTSSQILLYSICFPDANTGYAVGMNGGIAKTADGGETWINLSSHTLTKDLHSVFFINADTGYIVGAGRTFLKTVDGGITWTSKILEYGSSIYNYTLYSVFFTSANTGYVVGEGGLILKTTDGGATWLWIWSPTYMALRSVFFPYANTGYAVGGNYTNTPSIIIKTTDAGLTWAPQIDNLGTYDLSAVYFTDANTGYVVNETGKIFKTTSGGGPYTTLAVSPSGRIVGSTAGSADFIVSSDTNWIVTSDSPWCTVTPSGSGTDTIVAAYTENKSANPRVDTIRIRLQQLPKILKKITVTQGGVSGIENIGQDAFRIYPNPATEKITIKDTRNLYKDNTVSIYTITGDFVKEYQFRNQHQVEIDVSNLMQGVYLVKIQTSAGIEVQKLVIQ
jgi:photosystem II stability/assembly factor-like uncharacterized protein